MKAKRKIPKSPGPRSPKLAALETEIMEQHKNALLITIGPKKVVNSPRRGLPRQI